MNISIVNHTMGSVTDKELQRAIRAINRQIQEDFQPYWGRSARLRLEGRSAESPDTMQIPDLRGDAVIYLWNKADVEDALGYHELNAMGIPFGFVFTEVSRSIGEEWTVTLSHEALELIGDPETNLLSMGPHPEEDRDVFHWYEMCDAVQAETYEIDGVAVSNFVLPLYFTGNRDTDEAGARNDFLGLDYGGQTLTSFGINPGGYVGFFDPKLGDHDTFTIEGDAIALMRMIQKGRAKQTRRSVRYKSFAQRDKSRLPASKEKTTASAKISAPKNGSDGTPASPVKRRAYASIRTAKSLTPQTSKAVGTATSRRKSTSRVKRPRSR